MPDRWNSRTDRVFQHPPTIHTQQILYTARYILLNINLPELSLVTLTNYHLFTYCYFQITLSQLLFLKVQHFWPQSSNVLSFSGCTERNRMTCSLLKYNWNTVGVKKCIINSCRYLSEHFGRHGRLNKTNNNNNNGICTIAWSVSHASSTAKMAVDAKIIVANVTWRLSSRTWN